MSDEKLWGVIAAGNLGTVATIKKDGRPQLSDVSYIALPGLIRFSTRTSLAKVHNLRRDSRVSIKVSGEQGYAVAEGTAELTQVAWGLEDEVVEELIEIYRLIRGQEHPDWDEYRRAMVADGRLVVRIKVEHLYGWVM
ncbi:PPOX class F420-dependent oxidoreductase [Paractinoplanes lichenicola]|uniref:PPOX class F420-dependent oxidoreductase n=1 Tax=Paractinoplanes lichenicola TaxID=2802976 RepID=A0ABS1VH25_9ACTN|nr:PPOX class F420-dependent oxidoreductase [Actinoplanes lichenicola]MBL7254020.1 PPOX class F420-dependent oxidoreductase [Actinoplanes lichenicola]